ncbi:putative F-box protein At4g22180 [Gastrolobium bilobum]|uniref:putative F-box protein At4g22180 n=1 Tax=Gastrolobium bilobum TaxID=150636 RepID=UPI002AB23CFC|nr:putative F-box protein At4g22180 [Gastrolobium bilobum]XP_061373138.1 putative F-box protein At4g22180 [Gastrolobium bilobum]
MENKNKKQRLMSPDWSKTPTDVIEMIYKCLEFPDQARFGSVCKSWYSCTYNKPHLAVPNSTPWLIDDQYRSSQYNLFISPSHSQKDFKIYKPFRPFSDSFISESIKGWLVIQSRVKVFIVNLFSSVRIELPPRTTMPDFPKSKGNNNVSGMDTPVTFTISTCVHSNPIMVAAVTWGGDLIWCKIRSAKAWKGYRGDKEYGNLTFYNDKLYAVTGDGTKVDIFRVDDESSVLFLLQSIDSMQPTNDLLVYLQVYLVVSNEDVLVVKRYYDHRRELRVCEEPTIGFDIFKVQENCIPPNLVNVDTLGDQALFLSALNCESLPAKECSREEGCIYFIDTFTRSNAPLFKTFSVKDRSLRNPLPLPNMEYPIWVLPRFAFTCNCTCRHGSTLWKPKKKKKYAKRKTNVV